MQARMSTPFRSSALFVTGVWCGSFFRVHFAVVCMWVCMGCSYKELYHPIYLTRFQRRLAMQ